MRIATGVFAAILLTGAGWAGTAAAQGQPQGSYLRSCTNVSAGGDTLTATCRRADGREDRSALAGFRRCVGDIGNNNGLLQCSTQGGTQMRGQLIAEPPRGGPGYGGPGYGGPGYGGPAAGGPPPRGGPPPGDWREHCGQLFHETEELRARIAREFNPIERGRLESRLREVEAERARCR